MKKKTSHRLVVVVCVVVLIVEGALIVIGVIGMAWALWLVHHGYSGDSHVVVAVVSIVLALLIDRMTDGKAPVDTGELAGHLITSRQVSDSVLRSAIVGGYDEDDVDQILADCATTLKAYETNQITKENR
jgi:hypothetical protein